jgi:hypothetical protein
MHVEKKPIMERLSAGQPLSKRDWERALVAIEIAFASSYYGGESRPTAAPIVVPLLPATAHGVSTALDRPRAAPALARSEGPKQEGIRTNE